MENNIVDTELLEKLNGTVSIQQKTNGVQITIFMPFTEKPKREKQNTVVKYTARDQYIANVLYEVITKANPEIHVKWHKSNWANEIRLLRKSYDDAFIEKVIVHIYQGKDTFWRSRILSAAKLRQKFETVAAQMTGDKNKKGWYSSSETQN